ASGSARDPARARPAPRALEDARAGLRRGYSAHRGRAAALRGERERPAHGPAFHGWRRRVRGAPRAEPRGRSRLALDLVELAARRTRRARRGRGALAPGPQRPAARAARALPARRLFGGGHLAHAALPPAGFGSAARAGCRRAGVARIVGRRAAAGIRAALRARRPAG